MLMIASNDHGIVARENTAITPRASVANTSSVDSCTSGGLHKFVKAVFSLSEPVKIQLNFRLRHCCGCEYSRDGHSLNDRQVGRRRR